MPITVDAAVTTALNDPHFEYALCVQIPGGYNITDNPRSITVGGVTYTPDNLVLDGGDHTRRSEITADSADLVFDNADQTLYQDYVANDYEGQPIVALYAFVNDDYSVINANAYLPLFEGILDSWAATESGGRATLKLRSTSLWASWRTKKGRKTNSASQQQFFPNDTVFEYSHQEELPYKWGL